MNDLMDGLIQDMSTGNYTTKRPYPVQRLVLIYMKYYEISNVKYQISNVNYQ